MEKREKTPHHRNQVKEIVEEFMNKHEEYRGKRSLVTKVFDYQFRYAAHRLGLEAYEIIRFPRIGNLFPSHKKLIEEEFLYGTIHARKLYSRIEPSRTANSRSKKDLDKGSTQNERERKA